MNSKEKIEKIISDGETIINEMNDICNNISYDKQPPLLQEKGKLMKTLIPNLSSLHFDGIDNKLVRTYKAKLDSLKGQALEKMFNPHSKPLPSKSEKKELLTILKRSVLKDKGLFESWNSLGHFHEKERNYKQAKNCYEQSVKNKKNIKGYHGLSITVRRMDGNSTSKVALQKSIEYAKEGIKLDFKNGKSWYVMGNAYFYLYHTTMDHAIMKKAIQAYISAENFAKEKVIFPEIYHNRSVLYSFESNFKIAYEGFEMAYKSDKTMSESLTKMNQISLIIKELQKYIRPREEIVKEMKNKSKKILKVIPFTSSLSYIDKERLGVRVLGRISPPKYLPVQYVAVDKNYKFCVISMTFIQENAINTYDTLSIFKPEIVKENVGFLGGKLKEVHVVKVKKMNLMHINKKQVDKKVVVSNEMSSSFK